MVRSPCFMKPSSYVEAVCSFASTFDGMHILEKCRKYACFYLLPVYFDRSRTMSCVPCGSIEPIQAMRCVCAMRPTNSETRLALIRELVDSEHA